MAIVTKSRNSLDKKKYDFNKLVLNKILYVGCFQLHKPSFTAKCTSEKLIAK